MARNAHACVHRDKSRAEQSAHKVLTASKVLTRFSQEQRRAKCSQGVPAVEGMGQRLLLLGCHLQAAFAF